MSLAHAILGIIQNQPMTGYDLKVQCFDSSIAHFWQADQAQIYRTLDKLAEQGFATSQLEMQEDRPNRKVYYITKDGRLELRRWLLSDQALTAYREPFLVQLFFSDQLENEEVLNNLKSQLKSHEERLAHYKTIGLPPFDIPDMKREWFFQRMTLEMGLRVEQAYIDWLKDCIERVGRL